MGNQVDVSLGACAHVQFAGQKGSLGIMVTSGQQAKKNRVKILLVDDQSVVRSIYHKALEHAGFQVIEAADYEGAFELFDSSVDLALVDIVLEGKSGMEILTFIRKQQPLCPVIMISAHANKNNAIDALRKGAVDYLEKPVDLRELVHVVENWLSYRTLKEETIKLQKEQQLQHELRESEMRYHHLIEAIPDGILISCESRIVYANTAAASILKAADMDELIGRELLGLLDPKCRESVAEHVKHALQEQSSLPRLEGRLLKLNGESFDAGLSITHTDYLDEAAIQLVFHDITERKQAEDTLRKKFDEIESMNRLMVGRELKMEELRQENKRLKAEVSGHGGWQEG